MFDDESDEESEEVKMTVESPPDDSSSMDQKEVMSMCLKCLKLCIIKAMQI